MIMRTRMSWRRYAGLSGPSTTAVDEQNVPKDRNTHGGLPSPVTSVCMCCKTWSCWSYNHVCFPPPCRVPSNCGGLCSSPGGLGDSECHLVSFWPILNLPEWTLQALRALKGTLWWCLCYLCECCCRGKKMKWVKPEKPGSPQDGQLQQEEVAHVVITLKCLRKSDHLCVFLSLQDTGVTDLKGRRWYML